MLRKYPKNTRARNHSNLTRPKMPRHCSTRRTWSSTIRWGQAFRRLSVRTRTRISGKLTKIPACSGISSRAIPIIITARPHRNISTANPMVASAPPLPPIYLLQAGTADYEHDPSGKPPTVLTGSFSIRLFWTIPRIVVRQGHAPAPGICHPMQSWQTFTKKRKCVGTRRR